MEAPVLMRTPPDQSSGRPDTCPLAKAMGSSGCWQGAPVPSCTTWAYQAVATEVTWRLSPIVSGLQQLEPLRQLDRNRGWKMVKRSVKKITCNFWLALCDLQRLLPPLPHESNSSPEGCSGDRIHCTQRIRVPQRSGTGGIFI